jgi:hypothetical protein
MPVIAGSEIRRMFPIDVDGAECMRTPDIHDIDALEIRHVEDLYAVWGQELSGTT